ncbi:MAG: flagellar export protein FliJ [Spirochaetaceae bacterium]|nr:flagellar export protein FliJ [Spirochaetaceae bacterium]
MKKFDFSMQKILNLREFQEEQAKIELGKALSETNRIQSELEQIAVERVRIVQLCSETSVDQLIINERYIKRLDISRDRLLEELAAAELVVQEKRGIFAEAMKNRKVLTNLKEKKFKAYKKDAQLADDNVLDDIATSRFTKE